MFRSISLGVLGLASLSTLSQAGVLVVAPSGAPFTTIQTAVDAAVDGDVVLVKPGTYGGFTLNSKSLALVSDPAGAAHIAGATLIANVGVGRITSLSSFAVSAGEANAQRFDAPAVLAGRRESSMTGRCLAVLVLPAPLLTAPSAPSQADYGTWQSTFADGAGAQIYAGGVAHLRASRARPSAML